MTERVTIEGTGLTVEVDEGQPDPKRRRPAPLPPAPVAGRSIEEMVDVNPFWSQEANQAAEENHGLTPKQLAKQWHRHRIGPEAPAEAEQG